MNTNKKYQTTRNHTYNHQIEHFFFGIVHMGLQEKSENIWGAWSTEQMTKKNNRKCEISQLNTTQNAQMFDEIIGIVVILSELVDVLEPLPHIANARKKESVVQPKHKKFMLKSLNNKTTTLSELPLRLSNKWE